MFWEFWENTTNGEQLKNTNFDGIALFSYMPPTGTILQEPLLQLPIIPIVPDGCLPFLAYFQHASETIGSNILLVARGWLLPCFAQEK